MKIAFNKHVTGRSTMIYLTNQNGHSLNFRAHARNAESKMFSPLEASHTREEVDRALNGTAGPERRVTRLLLQFLYLQEKKLDR